MAKVPNAVEILPKILIASVACTSDTDRRQSDRRTGDSSERECEFTFAKIIILEYGQMPNAMAALPNIGGALCSTPQRLADTLY